MRLCPSLRRRSWRRRGVNELDAGEVEQWCAGQPGVASPTGCVVTVSRHRARSAGPARRGSGPRRNAGPDPCVCHRAVVRAGDFGVVAASWFVCVAASEFGSSRLSRTRSAGARRRGRAQGETSALASRSTRCAKTAKTSNSAQKGTGQPRRTAERGRPGLGLRRAGLRSRSRRLIGHGELPISYPQMNRG